MFDFIYMYIGATLVAVIHVGTCQDLFIRVILLYFNLFVIKSIPIL